ncbi:hypothetical protein CU097_010450 [Rhizopus azygosporus]|uniref:Uncharacterized protein n=1 Tax=Rhizopus azygosporus TaxID=86630 RepID=A0A367JJW9_RHIAZ|nr:hypothetical protein CU097_010450 [Rhizopus azygosporus]
MSKSILKASKPTNNQNGSWFSKLNNDTSLFNFRNKDQENSNDIINELSPKELRRVRFPVKTDLVTEYILIKEQDTLEKVVIEPVNVQTSLQLLSLYELICKNKQEPTIDSFVSTLIMQPQATSLSRLDLTNQHITKQSMSPLADIMSIDFGIRELILCNSGLEDDAVKILMHSLLENDKITYLNLSNNPKLTAIGYKYISVYAKESRQLSTLDLSLNTLDKKATQYLFAAITTSSMSRLILNGCMIRTTAQLQILASGVKKSRLQHLTLHQNRMNHQGALSIGVMLRDYDNTGGSLEHLELDGNEIGTGIQYIAQALKRNQNLRTLSLRQCKLDAKGCNLIGEALKYNQHLEKLDLGNNPSICTQSLDGIASIKQALLVNRSLKDLCLSDTGLTTEAVIAIAESLAENKSLSRLDLSKNPLIDIAGMMAIAVSIRLNHNITFIDINISTNDEEMIQIHHDMLAICTRNAQQTKKATVTTENEPKNNLVSTTQATARLTLQERLEAVTKGKVDDDSNLIQEALEILEEMAKSDVDEDMLTKCKELQVAVCQRIPNVSEPSQLELLLGINDKLTTSIENHYQDIPSTPIPEANLKKLHEIEAEEGAAFLNAKRQETPSAEELSEKQ